MLPWEVPIHHASCSSYRTLTLCTKAEQCYWLIGGENQNLHREWCGCILYLMTQHCVSLGGTGIQEEKLESSFHVHSELNGVHSTGGQRIIVVSLILGDRWWRYSCNIGGRCANGLSFQNPLCSSWQSPETVVYCAYRHNLIILYDPFNKENFVIYLSHFDQHFMQLSFPQHSRIFQWQ
jgi:hypothetical protein